MAPSWALLVPLCLFRSVGSSFLQAADVPGSIRIPLTRASQGFYTATLSVTGQSSRLLVDSGSGDLWVPEHSSPISVKAKTPGRPFKDTYGSGSTSGRVQSGMIEFSGGVGATCEYGLASQEDGLLQGLETTDGIWGLAPTGHIEGLVQCLSRQKRIPSQAVAVSLGESGGSLTLGASTDGLEMLPMVGNGKSWNVGLLGVSVQRHGATSSGKAKDHETQILASMDVALLDTGSSGIRAPSEDIERLAWALAAERKDDGAFRAPCRSQGGSQDVILKIRSSQGGDARIVLSSLHLLTNPDEQGWCDVALNPSTSGLWILGGVFFRRMKTVVFDYENRQVGFNQKDLQENAPVAPPVAPSAPVVPPVVSAAPEKKPAVVPVQQQGSPIVAEATAASHPVVANITAAEDSSHAKQMASGWKSMGDDIVGSAEDGMQPTPGPPPEIDVSDLPDHVDPKANAAANNAAFQWMKSGGWHVQQAADDEQSKQVFIKDTYPAASTTPLQAAAATVEVAPAPTSDVVAGSEASSEAPSSDVVSKMDHARAAQKEVMKRLASAAVPEEDSPVQPTPKAAQPKQEVSAETPAAEAASSVPSQPVQASQAASPAPAIPMPATAALPPAEQVPAEAAPSVPSQPVQTAPATPLPATAALPPAEQVPAEAAPSVPSQPVQAAPAAPGQAAPDLPTAVSQPEQSAAEATPAAPTTTTTATPQPQQQSAETSAQKLHDIWGDLEVDNDAVFTVNSGVSEKPGSEGKASNKQNPLDIENERLRSAVRKAQQAEMHSSGSSEAPTFDIVSKMDQARAAQREVMKKFYPFSLPEAASSVPSQTVQASQAESPAQAAPATPMPATAALPPAEQVPAEAAPSVPSQPVQAAPAAPGQAAPDLPTAASQPEQSAAEAAPAAPTTTTTATPQPATAALPPSEQVPAEAVPSVSSQPLQAAPGEAAPDLGTAPVASQIVAKETVPSTELAPSAWSSKIVSEMDEARAAQREVMKKLASAAVPQAASSVPSQTVQASQAASPAPAAPATPLPATAALPPAEQVPAEAAPSVPSQPVQAAPAAPGQAARDLPTAASQPEQSPTEATPAVPTTTTTATPQKATAALPPAEQLPAEAAPSVPSQPMQSAPAAQGQAAPDLPTAASQPEQSAAEATPAAPTTTTTATPQPATAALPSAEQVPAEAAPSVPSQPVQAAPAAPGQAAPDLPTAVSQPEQSATEATPAEPTTTTTQQVPTTTAAPNVVPVRSAASQAGRDMVDKFAVEAKRWVHHFQTADTSVAVPSPVQTDVTAEDDVMALAKADTAAVLKSSSSTTSVPTTTSQANERASATDDVINQQAREITAALPSPDTAAQGAAASPPAPALAVSPPMADLSNLEAPADATSKAAALPAAQEVIPKLKTEDFEPSPQTPAITVSSPSTGLPAPAARAAVDSIAPAVTVSSPSTGFPAPAAPAAVDSIVPAVTVSSPSAGLPTPPAWAAVDSIAATVQDEVLNQPGLTAALPNPDFAAQGVSPKLEISATEAPSSAPAPAVSSPTVELSNLKASTAADSIEASISVPSASENLPMETYTPVDEVMHTGLTVDDTSAASAPAKAVKHDTLPGFSLSNIVAAAARSMPQAPVSSTQEEDRASMLAHGGLLGAEVIAAERSLPRSSSQGMPAHPAPTKSLLRLSASTISNSQDLSDVWSNAVASSDVASASPVVDAPAQSAYTDFFSATSTTTEAAASPAVADVPSASLVTKGADAARSGFDIERAEEEASKWKKHFQGISSFLQHAQFRPESAL